MGTAGLLDVTLIDCASGHGMGYQTLHRISLQPYGIEIVSQVVLLLCDKGEVSYECYELFDLMIFDVDCLQIAVKVLNMCGLCNQWIMSDPGVFLCIQ